MTKIKLRKMGIKASSSIYVTLVALAIVVVVFALFANGIKEVNVSYGSEEQFSQDQSIKISESLVSDLGQSDISNDWDEDSVKKIGFKKEANLIDEIIDSNGNTIANIDFNSLNFKYNPLIGFGGILDMWSPPPKPPIENYGGGNVVVLDDADADNTKKNHMIIGAMIEPFNTGENPTLEIQGSLFYGGCIDYESGSETILDLNEETECVSYGIIEYNKLEAASDLTKDELLESLGLDDTVELKYGSDIHITVKNTLTDEMIWEYPQDFESDKEYTTLFQRTLTLYYQSSENIPVTFTLQIHQSSM